MSTTLGQAYVQILPSAKGISGEITRELNSANLGQAGEEAGDTAGKGFGRSFKAAVIMAAVAAAAAIMKKLIRASIEAGAALEQSMGGVQTLYKDNADKVIAYADEAYRTAGLSANEYMEQVTSFSASLLQSVGGDTEKAADIANMALIDMSDNANKFGTDMAAIQHAYQGFAKQNYTMLDNLKLGYGGTKSEMQRLLADAEKLTGIHYDINDLDDVYQAIHVIQGELGITGTTAEEAASTYSGSLRAMKAAQQNFLADLALGRDVEKSFANLIKTAGTFVFKNLIPMVGRIFKGLGKLIISGIRKLPSLILKGLNALLDKIGKWDTGKTGKKMSDMGAKFLKKLGAGMVKYLPKILKTIGLILGKLVLAFLKALPKLLALGVRLMGRLALGLLRGLGKVLAIIPTLIARMLKKFGSLLVKFMMVGKNIVIKIGQGIVQFVSKIWGYIKNFFINLVQGFKDRIVGFGTVAKDIVLAIGQGIVDFIGSIGTKIKEFVQKLAAKFKEFWHHFVEIGKNIVAGIWDGIKAGLGFSRNDISAELAKDTLSKVQKAFIIGSPSRLFAEEVGKWIPPGIAMGIEANSDSLYDTLRGLTDQSVTVGTNSLGSYAAMPAASGYTPAFADSIVSGMSTLAAAGNRQGNITLDVYLYPSGPKMGQTIVNTYDTYKKRYG